MSLANRLRKIATKHIDQFGRHPDSDTMLEAASALEVPAPIPGLKPLTKKEA